MIFSSTRTYLGSKTDPISLSRRHLTEPYLKPCDLKRLPDQTAHFCDQKGDATVLGFDRCLHLSSCPPVLSHRNYRGTTSQSWSASATVGPENPPLPFASVKGDFPILTMSQLGSNSDLVSFQSGHQQIRI